MHLFVSFILKAIAVFVKDVVLYEVGVDDCSPGTVSSVKTTRLLRFGCFQIDEPRSGGPSARSRKSVFTRAAETPGKANYPQRHMKMMQRSGYHRHPQQ